MTRFILNTLRSVVRSSDRMKSIVEMRSITNEACVFSPMEVAPCFSQLTIESAHEINRSRRIRFLLLFSAKL